MSVFLDISYTLNARLNAMASLPPVAWENSNEYKPVIGTLYLRPTVIPGDVFQSSLGENGQDQNVGIYQIDVFAESGEGYNDAIVMADLIANHFKRGTTLTYNNRTVRIRNTSRQVGINSNDGWYQVPVEIPYISFTTPRA